MRVLDTAQMREADRRTIEEIGIPSIVLMENAGRRTVDVMASAFGDLADSRVAILCGRGSNGGDGFVVARVLSQRGTDVQVFLLGAAADVRGDARTNLDVLGRLGVEVVEVPDAGAWSRLGPAATACDVIVDAVLGTGLNRPLSGMLPAVVADVNAALAPVASIDLPTGLSADDHRQPGPSIDADLTVTLAAPKIPLVLPPGSDCAGDVFVADIGIPEAVMEAVAGPRLELVTPAAARALIPERAPDAHKGTFGHVLIVAGSLGRTGAACLAGMGALKSGAGLVTVAVPRSCLPAVAAAAPEYMTLPLEEEAPGAVSAAALDTLLAAPCDVIAAGPGLGTGPGAAGVVHGLLERAGVPLVLDADALNICARHPDRLGARREPRVDVVLTPHPGEMARLCGQSTEAVQADRVAAARGLATAHGVHVALKGARTLVAAPDGSVAINLTGNPGMASGGAGDVLTGVTAAWVGQLAHTVDACKAAVYLHGRAADLAVREHGEVALTATDITAALGKAVSETIDPESLGSGNGTDRV